MRKEPSDINANSGLAAMAMADSSFDQARARLGTVLEAHPGHYQTLMNLAVLEETAGNTGAMVAAVEQAIEADPEALRPRLSLARYRLSEGKPREALRLLDVIGDQYRDEFALHQLLANAYLASDQPGLAAARGRQMLRLRPRDPRHPGAGGQDRAAGWSSRQGSQTR